MKKRLAILSLLVLAAICSAGPAARTYSHVSGNPQTLKLHAADSIAASAENMRTLAIRPMTECPPGYYDCEGCCVPYKCPAGGSGGGN